jgi:hypothetical protein
VTDRLDRVTLGPHCTVEFISGVCHALSEYEGEVYVEIRSINGKPVAKLKREVIDAAMPVYLRRQAE